MPLCFLALIPPKPIKEEIRSLKEEIYQKYGAKRALRLPAHITLQPPFKIETSQLPVLHNTIREFARTHHPILIDIEGFGAFPPRVIFIEVVNPGEIKKLQKQLKEILQKDLLAREDEMREFRPHITLATRDLPRNKFRSAWEEFRNRKFEKTFKAEGIFLFEHNGKTWDLSTEFRFLS
jgi:2'-5' RNA ligase